MSLKSLFLKPLNTFAAGTSLPALTLHARCFYCEYNQSNQKRRSTWLGTQLL